MQQDVLGLVDDGAAKRFVPAGKALGAGCSHWASVDKADMAYSSDMSYLEVSVTGFNTTHTCLVEATVITRRCHHLLFALPALFPLQVPYFGFGAINPRRPLEMATCHRPGQPACLPPGLMARLGETTESIEATLSGSVARRVWRQVVDFAQDYIMPATSVYSAKPIEDVEPAPFLEVGQSRIV